MSAIPAPVTRSNQPAGLRHRVETLRAEIAAAEAKIPRTYEAIRTRKQTLSRLEARLALEESHPAHFDND